MLLNLSIDQRALADYMSYLSERAYSAAWIEDLEFILWAQVVGPSVTSTRLALAEQEKVELRRLANLCGGWIVFDETSEETFLPLEQWTARYRQAT